MTSAGRPVGRRPADPAGSRDAVGEGAPSLDMEAALEWHTGEDERHVARTDDGWALALYRYLPAGDAARRPFPVVLGHGLCGSHLIFDVHAEYSLARALAARGFDVWLVDLRGRGESWPDGGPSDELQWTFDDFVFHDVPATVATVCEVSAAPEVFWVGTEMSGIALYAVAISGTTRRLRGGVTMGSPAVTPPDAQVPGVTTGFPRPEGTRLRFSMVSDIGPQLALRESEALEGSFRPRNTEWVVAARYFRHGVPDECTAIVEQFGDWITSATMRSVDGSVTWSDHLAEVALPVLVMVGAADLQRPAAAVEATFHALGSADKTFVRVGVDGGFPVDAGHDDLVTGLCAPTHVFPLVAEWLEARS